MAGKIVYLATRNLHKLEEIRAMAATNCEIRGLAELAQSPDWQETGATFLENAAIKAEAIKAVTEEAVLADDSGLAIDALDGSPGVRSARFAGEDATDYDNNVLMVEKLTKIGGETFSARFICSLYFIDASGKASSFEGVCEGHIILQPRGNGGFGYDPYFLPSGFDQTLAELSAEEKNRISHRFRAFERWLSTVR